MNIRIVSPIVAIACCALPGAVLPAGAALAEKPARIEVRRDGEEPRATAREPVASSGEARQERGPERPPTPARVREDDRRVQDTRTGGSPPSPALVRQDDRRAGHERRDDRPGSRDRGNDRGHDDRRGDGDRPPATYSPRRDRDRSTYDAWRHDDGSRYRHASNSHRYAHLPARHHYPARRYYYPPRGYVYPVLPRNVVVVRHHHHHYWYGGGIWYRPHGTRYIVVAPPVGVFVSVLPAYYSTFWFGGIPYYYANDAYYVWRETRRAYEVVAPPAGAEAVDVDPVTEDLFVYPREGQSEEQTAFDRYECHRWASDETGFDPTQAWGGVSEDRAGALREAYLRAMTACLDGRGYSVR